MFYIWSSWPFAPWFLNVFLSNVSRVLLIYVMNTKTQLQNEPFHTPHVSAQLGTWQAVENFLIHKFTKWFVTVLNFCIITVLLLTVGLTVISAAVCVGWMGSVVLKGITVQIMSGFWGLWGQGGWWDSSVGVGFTSFSICRLDCTA